MDLLSPAQVAKQLGVGLPYIYTLLASGKLCGFQENGRWRIRQVEVDNWKARTERRKKQVDAVLTIIPESDTEETVPDTSAEEKCAD